MIFNETGPPSFINSDNFCSPQTRLFEAVLEILGMFPIFKNGTPSVLFVWATLPLKPATIALKIGHLAYQEVI